MDIGVLAVYRSEVALHDSPSSLKIGHAGWSLRRELSVPGKRMGESGEHHNVSVEADQRDKAAPGS